MRIKKMINCRLGLISKPCDDSQDCFLNLGEVFDKTIRGDVNTLYELHKNMRYFCPFEAEVNGRDVRPDNMEEIITFQTRYKLTKKIWINGKIKNGTVKFRTPQLFDVSCMVPLFPDVIPHAVCPKGNTSPNRMFLLFPYSNPITRGEIVESCFNAVEGCNVFSTLWAAKKAQTQHVLAT